MERSFRGGRHAENGNGPRLLVNGLNSLSVLKFDGVNNYLRIPHSSDLNVGEDMSLFVVAKGDILGDWDSIISKEEKMMLAGNLGKITLILLLLQFGEQQVMTDKGVERQ